MRLCGSTPLFQRPGGAIPCYPLSEIGDRARRAVKLAMALATSTEADAGTVKDGHTLPFGAQEVSETRIPF